MSAAELVADKIRTSLKCRGPAQIFGADLRIEGCTAQEACDALSEAGGQAFLTGRECLRYVGETDADRAWMVEIQIPESC